MNARVISCGALALLLGGCELMYGIDGLAGAPDATLDAVSDAAETSPVDAPSETPVGDAGDAEAGRRHLFCDDPLCDPGSDHCCDLTGGGTYCSAGPCADAGLPGPVLTDWSCQSHSDCVDRLGPGDWICCASELLNPGSNAPSKVTCREWGLCGNWRFCDPQESFHSCDPGLSCIPSSWSWYGTSYRPVTRCDEPR